MLYKLFMRRHEEVKAYERQRQEIRESDARLVHQHRERLAVKILKSCGGDPNALARAYERYEWLADIEQAMIQRAARKR